MFAHVAGNYLHIGAQMANILFVFPGGGQFPLHPLPTGIASSPKFAFYHSLTICLAFVFSVCVSVEAECVCECVWESVFPWQLMRNQ